MLWMEFCCQRGGNFWPSRFEWSRSTLPNQRIKIGSVSDHVSQPLFGLLPMDEDTQNTNQLIKDNLVRLSNNADIQSAELE
jgi:hypothetical protein